MTGLRPPGALEHVSLVDYSGNELYRNESRLYPGDGPYLHFVGPLIPPKIFFFVRVRGKDAQNYDFLRITPTAIAAVDVVGPRAYMAERLTANAYNAINLTCSIESRVPFTVHWLFGSRTIGGPLFYEHTDTSTWTIDSVTPAHRGYYTCLVVSSLGNHSVSTFLESKELPPDIVSMRNVSVMLHETAFLHCITQSIERPRINWMHNHSLNVGNSAKTYTYDNGTLRIHDATFDDVGIYSCFARTSGGQSEETAWLTVMQPPSVRVEPRELYSVEGTTFTLKCITTGVPKPEVTCQRDELIVSDVEDEDEGSYSCQAKNLAGNAIASAYVQIAVPPIIHVSQNKQMITKDDSIILDCQVISGIPPPTIVWWKDGRQLFNDRYIQIQEGGRLTIPRADISDAGTYACKAENIAGSAIKPLTLGVGSPPTILPSPETVYVQIGQTATLNCRVDGNPKPQIQWLKNGSPIDALIEEQLRYSHLPDDSLHIRGASLSDQSTFTCIVRNQFGEQRKRTNLVITGLVSPVLASLPSKMELVEGRDLQINCVVLLGNPRPEIEWILDHFKDGQPLSKAISKEHVIFLRDGSLLLKNGSDAHKGTYTCKANSAAGNALQDVNVQLIMKPRMLQTDIEDVLVAKDGAQLEIPCPVLVPEGQVRPKVLWAHDSQPLNVNTPEYIVLPNLSLRILRVSSAHIGRYTCTAVNEAGKLEKTTLVLGKVLNLKIT
uniref:Ig-like domain-containing protein n=1 Tax=Meloidogyne javanica TaxID=6303 RepID=A0A915MU68_MELJA